MLSPKMIATTELRPLVHLRQVHFLNCRQITMRSAANVLPSFRGNMPSFEIAFTTRKPEIKELTGEYWQSTPSMSEETFLGMGYKRERRRLDRVYRHVVRAENPDQGELEFLTKQQLMPSNSKFWRHWKAYNEIPCVIRIHLSDCHPSINNFAQQTEAFPLYKDADTITKMAPKCIAITTAALNF